MLLSVGSRRKKAASCFRANENNRRRERVGFGECETPQVAPTGATAVCKTAHTTFMWYISAPLTSKGKGALAAPLLRNLVFGDSRRAAGFRFPSGLCRCRFAALSRKSGKDFSGVLGDNRLFKKDFELLVCERNGIGQETF